MSDLTEALQSWMASGSFVYLDDIGMMQTGQSLRLGAEASQYGDVAIET